MSPMVVLHLLGARKWRLNLSSKRECWEKKKILYATVSQNPCHIDMWVSNDDDNHHIVLISYTLPTEESRALLNLPSLEGS